VRTAVLVENKSLWRHLKCSIVVDLKKRYNMCDKLFPFFRIYKQRYQIKKKSYIGSTLTLTRRGVLKSILSEKKNLKNSNVR